MNEDTTARKGNSQMNKQPEPTEKNRIRQDGLAALAIVVIAAVLIFTVINHFV